MIASSNREIDATLIERVKKGDTLAFRNLVDKYKDVSLSLACSIIKDKALAEDVLQEAFLKVFYKANSFKHKSSFSSWLYRIVINTSYNELKRDKNHLKLDEINSNGPLADGKTPMQTLKEEDQKKYVVLALEKLKPDEALVLRLFYLCDFSLKEIASITHFKIPKIKADLHRGRKNLEEVLKNLLGKQLNDLV